MALQPGYRKQSCAWIHVGCSREKVRGRSIFAHLRESRDAYKIKCKQLSICKEARGKALEKVLSREEQRFSDLKSRIDFYETRIELLRSQQSRPLPPMPMQTPGASPGSHPQQEFELVSSHTVIEVRY